MGFATFFVFLPYCMATDMVRVLESFQRMPQQRTYGMAHRRRPFRQNFGEAKMIRTRRISRHFVYKGEHSPLNNTINFKHILCQPILQDLTTLLRRRTLLQRRTLLHRCTLLHRATLILDFSIPRAQVNPPAPGLGPINPHEVTGRCAVRFRLTSCLT
jgi:hypothetical protein